MGESVLLGLSYFTEKCSRPCVQWLGFHVGTLGSNVFTIPSLARISVFMLLVRERKIYCAPIETSQTQPLTDALPETTKFPLCLLLLFLIMIF